MKYISTQNKVVQASFSEALLQGLAPDGGLYYPSEVPHFSDEELKKWFSGSSTDLAIEIIHAYIKDEFSKEDVSEIIEEALNFDIPLIQVSERRYILELFHGPTEAFKDIGARFMSRSISRFLNEEITILVATSGDTGSAVADGFWKVPGVRVIVLFPKNGVSPYQESQMTTLGKNITAVEVEGQFDDCQDLVKRAFNDLKLRKECNLSSANSINIGRLLPQSLYYYFIMQQWEKKIAPVVCVPSGNFGNLTSGLYAQKSGLNIPSFIAATNSNSTFPDYLTSGSYTPRPSVATLSNAMDVGKPSNFERILTLYNNNIEAIRSNIQSLAVNDDRTVRTIREVFDAHGYLLDPHAAVGWAACDDLLSKDQEAVILGTAHPRKFEKAILEAIPEYKLEFPKKNGESMKLRIRNNYEQFIEIILNNK